MNNISRAWVPGHATLFFGVPKKYKNTFDMGSIGGGFNFSEGVTTEVEISSSNKVFWNLDEITGEVTKTSINLLRNLVNFEENFLVRHISKLPIGYGLSTSGAGAIGVLLAINHLLDLKIADIDIFEMAHQAELYHHTGLGSVVGQITTGIELRLSQGGPHKCDTKSFRSAKTIIILLFAPLKTSSIITSEEIMEQVTNAGYRAIKDAQLVNGDIAVEFVKLGQQFTENCGLITKRVRKVQDRLQAIGEELNAMAMIGETIIIIPKDVNKLQEWLKKENISYLSTSITNRSPGIIK